MGLTVLDTGVVIAILDASDAHHLASIESTRAGRDRRDEFVLPASAYAELLVGPTRRGRDAVETVDAFLSELPIRIQDLTADIARQAARLRARLTGLRLPDALVVATAVTLQASRLITTDRGWPSRSKLQLRGRLEVLAPTE